MHVVQGVVAFPRHGRDIDHPNLAKATAALCEGIALILGDLTGGDQGGFQVFRIGLTTQDLVDCQHLFTKALQGGAGWSSHAHDVLVDTHGREELKIECKPWRGTGCRSGSGSKYRW